jgi:hypothetical protein
VNRVFHWLGRLPDGGDQPGLIPRQPIPTEVRVCRVKLRGSWVTSLFRVWKREDIPACRLCPLGTCSAVNGSCLLLVTERIEDDQAGLYQIGEPPQRSPR